MRINAAALYTNVTPVLRSAQAFSFRTHCLFCGQHETLLAENRDHDVFPVRTTDFQREVMSICLLRGDAWADTVRGRLEFVNDLNALDVIYHQTCNVNFRTGKNVPSALSLGRDESESKRGRPISHRIHSKKLIVSKTNNMIFLL